MNPSMDNLVQIANTVFSFQKVTVCSRYAHVTVGVIPSFGTDPTCKTLSRFKFLYVLGHPSFVKLLGTLATDTLYTCI